MTRQLIVRAMAEAELADAIQWYQGRRDGLGREFLNEVQVTFDEVVNRPDSFPIDFGPMRRALVRRFPYAVHFVLYHNTVVILAVLHERQDKETHLGSRQ